MKIFYDDENRNTKMMDLRNVTIRLNKDVDFRISINNFGELEIQKSNFGSGNSGIEIHPNVSNEIRLK